MGEIASELVHRRALRRQFRRLVEGSEVVAGPHNFYIEMLIRTGAVGLLALLALTVGCWSRLANIRRRRRRIWVGCAPGLACDAADLVYAWVPGNRTRNRDGDRNSHLRDAGDAWTNEAVIDDVAESSTRSVGV